MEDRFDIPIQPVFIDLAEKCRIQIDMLRLDRTDTVVSGNKWFKLIRNIQAAKSGGYSRLLSFGGAWSNHLVAMAAASSDAGLGAIGMVRGLHAADNLTPSLKQCRDMGMQLRFLSREDYTRKDDPGFLEHLRQEWDGVYIIPEGGANPEGRAGAGLIAKYIPDHYTHICLSVGSGTTLAGLRQALPLTQQVIGFAPMKGGAYLQPLIAGWLSPEQNRNWYLTDDYHFGGFGKITIPLQQWMQDFYRKYHIPLDRVYTAKMMYGVLDMIQQGCFTEKSSVLCIHTGGLQGNTGMRIED